METIRTTSSNTSCAEKRSVPSRAGFSSWRTIFYALILLLILGRVESLAQGVGIGEDSFSPDPSAILELKHTSGTTFRGFLAPRMTTLNRTGMASHAQGLLVYDTDLKCFFYYDGGWIAVAAAGGTSVLPVANGGTGLSSYSIGDIVYASGAGTLSSIADVAVGRVLSSGGAGAAPLYTATPILGVNATTAGTLGLANGNASGLTVTIQNPSATTAYNFNLPATAGTSGQALLSGGGGSTAMSFGTLGLAAGGTGATTKAAAFDALSPMSALGDIIYYGGSGTGTALAKSTDGKVLTLVGGLPSWASVSLGSSNLADPSSTIGLTANNGTALTAMRSDAAPALNVGITPTWTGTHNFSVGLSAYGAGINLNASSNFATNINTGTSSGAVTIGNSANHTFFPELSTTGIVTNAASGQLGTVASVPVANGGTGLTSGTLGGIPFFSSSSAMSSSLLLTQYGIVIGGGAGTAPSTIGVGSAGQVLQSNGAGSAPSWVAASNQTISLAGDASGSGTSSITTTVGKVNGVSYSASPGTNTVPVVTGSNTVTYEAVPIAAGGTGATAQQTAINALTGTQSSGKYLRSDGTNATLSTIQASDVPTLNQNTTGSAGSAGSFSGSLTGDVTGTQGATVVGKINGTSLAGLTTGILKNTTGTGVPSIAVAGDFPTLNQNTTGSAASFTGSLAGDVTGTQSATAVGKINGTSLAALATGILKNTTVTGVPSIAVAGDFPTLNQNTTGSAASFTGSLAGDVTGTQGATVVGKINGTSLAGLTTGILKNTTGTGVPSIAVAGDFPTLNQSTTGTASNVTGTVVVGNGGTGATTLTAHGVVVGQGTSTVAVTSAGTAGQVLQSGGASADPAYSTATYPATTTANQILYSSAANTLGGLSTANGGILNTSNAGVPSVTATPTLGVNATTTGQLSLANGGALGTSVTIQNNGATTAYNFNLPTAAGTAGQPLLSGGGGATAMTFGTLGVGAGGTGLSAGISGGIPYFSSTSAIASSALLAANAVMIGGGAGVAPSTIGLGTTTTVLHGNAAGAPSYGQIVNADITNTTIDLTTKVTGTLPVANGGTGTSTAPTQGGVIFGSSSSAFASTAAGSTGQILRSAATGTPTWSTATYPAAAGNVGSILSSDGTNFTSGALPTLEAFLGANVVLTANTWSNGPSIALTQGTWLVTGTITVSSPNATAQRVTARLWDGTTTKVSSEAAAPSQGAGTAGYVSISLSGMWTVGAGGGTVWLAAASTAASTIRTTVGDNSPAANTATSIRAVRIGP